MADDDYEGLASAAAASNRTFSFDNSGWSSRRVGNSTLVLLLHGLGSNVDRTWSKAAPVLFADPGLVHVDFEGWNYATTKLKSRIPMKRVEAPLHEIASTLDQEIARHQEKYARVVVMAHSLGGLLVMAAVGHLLLSARPERIQRLAGLGFVATPVAGSHISELLDQVWNLFGISDHTRDTKLSSSWRKMLERTFTHMVAQAGSQPDLWDPHRRWVPVHSFRALEDEAVLTDGPFIATHLAGNHGGCLDFEKWPSNGEIVSDWLKKVCGTVPATEDIAAFHYSLSPERGVLTVAMVRVPAGCRWNGKVAASLSEFQLLSGETVSKDVARLRSLYHFDSYSGEGASLRVAVLRNITPDEAKNAGALVSEATRQLVRTSDAGPDCVALLPVLNREGDQVTWTKALNDSGITKVRRVVRTELDSPVHAVAQPLAQEVSRMLSEGKWPPAWITVEAVER